MYTNIKQSWQPSLPTKWTSTPHARMHTCTHAHMHACTHTHTRANNNIILHKDTPLQNLYQASHAWFHIQILLYENFILYISPNNISASLCKAMFIILNLCVKALYMTAFMNYITIKALNIDYPVNWKCITVDSVFLLVELCKTSITCMLLTMFS